MGNGKKSETSGANPDPAGQEHSWDHSSEPPENGSDGEEGGTLARAEATLTLLSAWVGNIQKLFQLELERTLTAGRRLILLQLMLVPLGTALLVSFCGGLGLIAYYFSQSVYLGFLIFLLIQIAIFIGILLYQRKLRPLLGFEQTKQQVREALSDVTETFK